MSGLLIDTDVLVAYLAGEELAADFLEFTPESLHVAALTVAELLSSVRGQAEEDAINACLSAFTILPFDALAAREAADLRRKHPTLSPGDAQVAGIARSRELRLVTLQRHRYPNTVIIHIPWRKIL